MVRTCVVARDVDYDRPSSKHFRVDDDRELFLARLREPLLDREVASLLECVVFDPNPYGDGGGYADGEASSLAPWIASIVPIDRWNFRSQAAATFLRAVDFSDDGFIGNGAIGVYLYKLAALEVTKPT